MATGHGYWVKSMVSFVILGIILLIRTLDYAETSTIPSQSLHRKSDIRMSSITWHYSIQIPHYSHLCLLHSQDLVMPTIHIESNTMDMSQRVGGEELQRGKLSVELLPWDLAIYNNNIHFCATIVSCYGSSHYRNPISLTFCLIFHFDFQLITCDLIQYKLMLNASFCRFMANESYMYTSNIPMIDSSI